MEGIKPCNGGSRDVLSPPQKQHDLVADEGKAPDEVGPPHGGQVGRPGPGQEVPGQDKPCCKKEQDGSHHPVKVTRSLVGALHKDPQNVDRNGEHHPDAGPVMDGPEEPDNYVFFAKGIYKAFKEILRFWRKI